MSEKREYPFKTWTLLPSFKPVEVELVGKSMESGVHVTSTGSCKHEKNLFETKELAISIGRALLDQMEQKARTTLERMAKKRATLDKAERQ